MPLETDGNNKKEKVNEINGKHKLNYTYGPRCLCTRCLARFYISTDNKGGKRK